MEQRNFEQRCVIKFCVKLGETASVTFEKLKQVYGEHSLSRAQVFRWHKSFLKGREHVEDEPRSGRPSNSKTEENVDLVRSGSNQYTEIKREEASTSHCGIEFIEVNCIYNNDKLFDNSRQTDDDKSNVLIESVNIKTECDEENNQDYNYATGDCIQEFFIKTEIDIKEEMLD